MQTPSPGDMLLMKKKEKKRLSPLERYLASFGASPSPVVVAQEPLPLSPSRDQKQMLKASATTTCAPSPMDRYLKAVKHKEVSIYSNKKKKKKKKSKRDKENEASPDPHRCQTPEAEALNLETLAESVLKSIRVTPLSCNSIASSQCSVSKIKVCKRGKARRSLAYPNLGESKVPCTPDDDYTGRENSRLTSAITTLRHELRDELDEEATQPEMESKDFQTLASNAREQKRSVVLGEISTNALLCTNPFTGREFGTVIQEQAAPDFDAENRPGTRTEVTVPNATHMSEAVFEEEMFEYIPITPPLSPTSDTETVYASSPPPEDTPAVPLQSMVAQYRAVVGCRGVNESSCVTSRGQAIALNLVCPRGARRRQDRQEGSSIPFEYR
jgi:hypothetical protein